MPRVDVELIASDHGVASTLRSTAQAAQQLGTAANALTQRIQTLLGSAAAQAAQQAQAVAKVAQGVTAYQSLNTALTQVAATQQRVVAGQAQIATAFRGVALGIEAVAAAQRSLASFTPGSMGGALTQLAAAQRAPAMFGPTVGPGAIEAARRQAADATRAEVETLLRQASSRTVSSVPGAAQALSQRTAAMAQAVSEAAVTAERQRLDALTKQRDQYAAAFKQREREIEDQRRQEMERGFQALKPGTFRSEMAEFRASPDAARMAAGNLAAGASAVTSYQFGAHAGREAELRAELVALEGARRANLGLAEARTYAGLAALQASPIERVRITQLEQEVASSYALTAMQRKATLSNMAASQGLYGGAARDYITAQQIAEPLRPEFGRQQQGAAAGDLRQEIHALNARNAVMADAIAKGRSMTAVRRDLTAAEHQARTGSAALTDEWKAATEQSAKLEKQLGDRAGGLSGTLTNLLSRTGRLAAVIAGFATLRAGMSGLRELFMFQSQLEQLRLGAAETISVAGRFTDPLGNALPMAEQFAISVREGQTGVRLMAEDSVRLGLNLADMTTAFTSTAGLAKSAGFSLQQHVQFLEAIVVLSQRLNIQQNILIRDFDNLLSGQNISRTVYGAILQLSEKQITAQRQQGDLAGFMLGRLEGITYILPKNLETWKGITEAIGSSARLLTEDVGSGFFETLKEAGREVLRILEAIRAERAQQKNQPVLGEPVSPPTMTGIAGQAASALWGPTKAFVADMGRELGFLLSTLPVAVATGGAVVADKGMEAFRGEARNHEAIAAQLVARRDAAAALGHALEEQIQRDGVAVAATDKFKASMQVLRTETDALKESNVNLGTSIEHMLNRIGSGTIRFQTFSKELQEFFAESEAASGEIESRRVARAARVAHRRAGRTLAPADIRASEAADAAAREQAEQDALRKYLRTQLKITSPDVVESGVLAIQQSSQDQPSPELQAFLAKRYRAQSPEDYQKAATAVLKIRGDVRGATEDRALDDADKIEALRERAARRGETETARQKTAATALQNAELAWSNVQRRTAESQFTLDQRSGEARLSVLQAQLQLSEQENAPLSDRLQLLQRINEIEQQNLQLELGKAEAIRQAAERTVTEASEKKAAATTGTEWFVADKAVIEANDQLYEANQRIYDLQQKQTAEYYRQQQAVEQLRDAHFQVGDILKGSLSDAIKGIALGTGDLKDLPKRTGQAVAGRFIEGFINEKLRDFDPKIKKNFLSTLPGFGKEGGKETGKALIGGFEQSVGGENGPFASGLRNLAELVTGDTGAPRAGSLRGIPNLPDSQAQGTAFGRSTGDTRVAQEQAAYDAFVKGQGRPSAGELASGQGTRAQQEAAMGARTSAIGNSNLIIGILGAAATVIYGIGQGIRAASKAAERPGATLNQTTQAAASQLPIVGELTGAFKSKEITQALLALPPGIQERIGLFQPKTSGVQQKVYFSQVLDQLGVPRATQGRDSSRGLSFREQPLASDIAALRGEAEGIAGFVGARNKSFQGAEKQAASTRILLNNLNALRLAGEDAQKILQQVAIATGESLDKSILAFVKLRAQGRVTDAELSTNIIGALKAFGQLPNAIDASRIALDVLDKSGRVSVERIKREIADATSVIVQGGTQALDVLRESGNAALAGQSLADSFAETFNKRLNERLLAEGSPIGKRLTAAVSLEVQAAEAFASGDTARGRELLTSARQEFFGGRQDFLRGVSPVINATRYFGASLGASGPGTINQTGFGSPSFDTPTMTTVPGAVGAPLPAVVHGGEVVYNPQYHGDLITELRALRAEVRELKAGQRVVVNVPTPQVTLQVDKKELGRTVSSAMHDGVQYQRSGSTLPTQIGVR